MNIPLKLKMYFSAEARELRRIKKAIKLEQLFQAEYQRLVKKNLMEKLKAEIREHELKVKGTSPTTYGLGDSVANFGSSLKRGLDSMSQNLRYNSMPVKRKNRHARRYQIYSPMSFALPMMNNRNPNRTRKRNYVTALNYL